MILSILDSALSVVMIVFGIFAVGFLFGWGVIAACKWQAKSFLTKIADKAFREIFKEAGEKNG